MLLHRLPEDWQVKATAAHGDEALRFPGGGEIVFKTRTAGGLRGFTFDRLVLDEAQILDTAEVRAIVPTYRARESRRQILYLATAPNAVDNSNCVVLLHELRERARRNDARGLTYLEWSRRLLEEHGDDFEKLTGDLIAGGVIDLREWLAHAQMVQTPVQNSEAEKAD